MRNKYEYIFRTEEIINNYFDIIITKFNLSLKIRIIYGFVNYLPNQLLSPTLSMLSPTLSTQSIVYYRNCFSFLCDHTMCLIRAWRRWYHYPLTYHDI